MPASPLEAAEQAQAGSYEHCAKFHSAGLDVGIRCADIGGQYGVP